jgi:hypothetical protein
MAKAKHKGKAKIDASIGALSKAIGLRPAR